MICAARGEERSRVRDGDARRLVGVHALFWPLNEQDRVRFTQVPERDGALLPASHHKGLVVVESDIADPAHALSVRADPLVVAQVPREEALISAARDRVHVIVKESDACHSCRVLLEVRDQGTLAQLPDAHLAFLPAGDHEPQVAGKLESGDAAGVCIFDLPQELAGAGVMGVHAAVGPAGDHGIDAKLEAQRVTSAVHGRLHRDAVVLD
mmetsp:Transcript_13098/g.33425  ORF Transcript_13098/g.33425 Transcript_13098/m.33425 type:complete len:210 (-) Transcript_13098:650-1279(-)